MRGGGGVGRRCTQQGVIAGEGQGGGGEVNTAGGHSK